MLAIRKQVCVSFLLFSFMGVQLISVGCTLINIIHSITHIQHPHSVHNNGSSDHHTADDEPKNSNDKEKCCVENSSIFLSGLKVNLVSSNLTLPITSVKIYSLFEVESPSILSIKSFIHQIRPPPNLILFSSFRRVVLQSLQV